MKKYKKFLLNEDIYLHHQSIMQNDEDIEKELYTITKNYIDDLGYDENDVVVNSYVSSVKMIVSVKYNKELRNKININNKVDIDIWKETADELLHLLNVTKGFKFFKLYSLNAHGFVLQLDR